MHDPVALAEIELYADLVLAASAWAGPMSLATLDELLGVTPRPATAPALVLPDRPSVVDLRDRVAPHPVA